MLFTFWNSENGLNMVSMLLLVRLMSLRVRKTNN